MVWKVATFNVNGIRARLPIVLDWLAAHEPDVLCLQEIKCQDKDWTSEPFLEAGYCVAVRGQKSFNGVATLTRRAPTQVMMEFGDGSSEDEARFLAIEVDGVWVINTYVPQGRSPDDPAFQHKLGFFSRLQRWLECRFTPSHLIVWTGDLNVAPEPIDVFDPKRLAGQVGFHPLERAAFAQVASWGLVDLYRKMHPEERQFTFWDYRLPKSFERNLGWRLDHIMVTAPMAAACTECRVDTEPRGREKPSDHTPVWASMELAILI